MLPKTFTCKHCNEDIELDQNELSLNEIICPACNKSLKITDMAVLPISIYSRITSMFLDHVIMTFIATVFVIPASIYSSLHPETIGFFHTNMTDIFGILNYISFVGFALYLCKDNIGGRSIAKRIMKFVVVDNSSGEPARPIRTLIRNAFCILWPIEVIITLFNPSRRLGDYVAGTKVVLYDISLYKDKTVSYRQILISFAIAYSSMLVIWRLILYMVVA